MDLNPEFVEWTKTTIDMMKIGGCWMIPRSGVVVIRTGETTVLVDKSRQWGYEDLLEGYLEAAGFTIEEDRE